MARTAWRTWPRHRSGKGYPYLGLTDHSQTAHCVGGLRTGEGAAQQRAVDRLNERYGSRFHVFEASNRTSWPTGRSHGVVVEINAHPWRLDMDWRWCEGALELGCLFSINPDAHSTAEIDTSAGACSRRARARCPGNACSPPWALRTSALF
jgi:histidinol phosphatase-like PHP family hydrolase